MKTRLRFFFALATLAAVPALANEQANEAPVDLAVRAAFEICPSMIERGDGLVTEDDVSGFRLQPPLDGGDRTLWAIGEPKNAIALAWIPNRQECSVMHSGQDQLSFLEKLENRLSHLDGYQRTARQDDGKYLTQIYNRQSASGVEAAHYVIVKTNDGRWVNVWYGKGTR